MGLNEPCPQEANIMHHSPSLVLEFTGKEKERTSPWHCRCDTVVEVKLMDISWREAEKTVQSRIQIRLWHTLT